MEFYLHVLAATKGFYFQAPTSKIVRIEDVGSQTCLVTLFTEEGKRFGAGTVHTDDLFKHYRDVPIKKLEKLGLPFEKSLVIKFREFLKLAQTQPSCTIPDEGDHGPFGKHPYKKGGDPPHPYKRY